VELKKQLSSSLNISQVIAQVLINRGLSDESQARNFLYGDIEKLGNPYLLKDMANAVERISAAIRDKEKIAVYGDYDVDGITASALMIKVLQRLGAVVDHYIPERQSEGYGLNITALDYLSQRGTQLIITVDCGISAIEEVSHIRDRLDIIITDHHQPPENVPDAYAIINPKQKDCSYPEKALAGVGVAYKLCQALWQYQHNSELLEYLDLVAIGTVADIVPLTGENRILVKHGLQQLAQTENLGLRSLLEVCGLANSNVDAGKVGFVIAPRLNAAGRLSRASAGVELLITHDAVKARELACFLEEENIQRQTVEKEILTKAENLIATMDIEEAKVLVLAGDSWHPGVIGIVASRLVDRYYRPVIVISLQDGIGKGSCRSIPGFDMYNALNQCSDILIQFGGHQQAAGLTVLAENIGKLSERLSAIARQVLTEEDYVPVLKIDSLVALEEINAAFLEQLADLEPYGMGNPRPIFACEELFLTDIRSIGQEGRHLKFRVKRKNCINDGIAWEMGSLAQKLQSNTSVDVAFQPEFNEWQGRRSIQLRAYDIRETVKDVSSHIDKLYDREQHHDNKYKNILQAERFFTKIVGVTFDNRQEHIAKLELGQQLLLKREPENPYDLNAIRVETNSGEMIGYLRAELAKELASAIDNGRCYHCLLAAITGTKEGPKGVNILIYQKGNTVNTSFSPRRELSEPDLIREALLGDRHYHDSQNQVLEYLAAGQNTMAIMGTGRGKSAIFQSHAALLALRHHKMTVIIYPLRALVNDQYMNLSRTMAKLGLSVYKGNGTLSAEERAQLFEALSNQQVDILLTTPEFAEANLPILEKSCDQVGFFVVDECHHISHSGKQRPVYQRLGKIIKKLGNPLVLGVTATADSHTTRTVQETLSINKVFVDKTIRSNLRMFDARGCADKLSYILNLLKTEEKILIFVNSRKKAYDIAQKLRESFPEMAQQTGFYHAGLSNEWRVNVEEWFRQGILKVVVATSAFGEGIDLPDIRHVVQYHLAFNLTTFNQQCGRAGRDGQSSTVHLLFGDEDIKLNQLILKDAAPDRSSVGRIYLVLKEAAKTDQTICLTNQQIADQVYNKYFEFVGEHGVGVALKILEELNLLWRETLGAKRTIHLNEVPAEKRDIEQSLTYREGVLERQEFIQFAKKVMNVPVEELLSWVNQPLYPKEFTKEV